MHVRRREREGRGGGEGARGRRERRREREAPPPKRPPDLKPIDLSGWANIAVHVCNVHSQSVTEFQHRIITAALELDQDLTNKCPFRNGVVRATRLPSHRSSEAAAAKRPTNETPRITPSKHASLQRRCWSVFFFCGIKIKLLFRRTLNMPQMPHATTPL